jgi:hypothetical protein
LYWISQQAAKIIAPKDTIVRKGLASNGMRMLTDKHFCGTFINPSGAIMGRTLLYINKTVIE